MTSISALPEEILLVVLHHLGGDNLPISRALSDQVPTEQLFRDREPECSLKAFSRVCRNWRRIAYPILFRYVKLNIDKVIWCDEDTCDADGHRSEPPRRTYAADMRTLDLIEAQGFRAGEVFEWAQKAKLTNITTHVFLYATPRPVHDHKEYDSWRVGDTEEIRLFMGRTGRFRRTLRYTWLLQRIFCLLDPISILVAASPYRLATIMGHAISMKDGWAFDIPLQTVELSMSKAAQERRQNFALCPPRSMEDGNLLDLQTWDQIDFHGGSCLNVYGTCMCSLISEPSD